jgi:hypothetical protein
MFERAAQRSALSRAAPIDRQGGRAESSLQNRPDPSRRLAASARMRCWAAQLDSIILYLLPLGPGEQFLPSHASYPAYKLDSRLSITSLVGYLADLCL